MGWFKGDDPMPDESIDMEAQKASVVRLASEMAELSAALLQKANELQKEIKNGRRASSVPQE